MPTIREVAEEYFGGEIDIDVCDTEIDDLYVAFCYTVGDCNDAYDKFLGLLCDNVIVVKLDTVMNCMTCDFSGFYRIYRDKLNKWIDKNITREFDEDEAEYDLVVCTEALISGGVPEKYYASLLSEVFT